MALAPLALATARTAAASSRCHLSIGNRLSSRYFQQFIPHLFPNSYLRIIMVSQISCADKKLIKQHNHFSITATDELSSKSACNTFNLLSTGLGCFSCQSFRAELVVERTYPTMCHMEIRNVLCGYILLVHFLFHAFRFSPFLCLINGISESGTLFSKP